MGFKVVGHSQREIVPYVISGVTAIRDGGTLLIGLVAIYSYFRLLFEYRGPLQYFAIGIWARQNLTPRGIVYRSRVFRFIGYSLAWWLGWSVILVGLFIFFPGAFS
jgi:hypothetical protein